MHIFLNGNSNVHRCVSTVGHIKAELRMNTHTSLQTPIHRPAKSIPNHFFPSLSYVMLSTSLFWFSIYSWWYSFIGRNPTSGPYTLERISKTVNIFDRLQLRKECSFAEFTSALDLRAMKYGRVRWLRCSLLDIDMAYASSLPVVVFLFRFSVIKKRSLYDLLS